MGAFRAGVEVQEEAQRGAVGRSREAQDPAPPNLKIMRRPQEAGGQARPSPGPQQGQKSLKQREREYAEARKRILGEGAKGRGGLGAGGRHV